MRGRGHAELLEELAGAQIAEILGVSPAAASQLLTRAVRRLRALLAYDEE
jgi:DNA-directed RNA polymerase specialized sigma24 family protein